MKKISKDCYTHNYKGYEYFIDKVGYSTHKYVIYGDFKTYGHYAIGYTNSLDSCKRLIRDDIHPWRIAKGE